MSTSIRKKPNLSFWQIWNMSFGFLGIQFGFALQGGFMSRIFQTLGATADEIPMLWIAAPLTGLLVQPIVGYLSDRTWSLRWGRRKPYFLIGAILSSLALFFMPYSSGLWMAAGFLWILDASINISMEPFRALVGDKLNEEQRSYGFVVQTLIIGIGTWVASNLPWFVNNILKIENTAGPNVIAPSVKIAFAIGAFVFLTSILYTIFSTTEYPPEDEEAFQKEKEKSGNFFAEISQSFSEMPETMKKLGLVQFFSWFAFFTMWSMATPALTAYVFEAPIPLERNFDLEQAAQLELYKVADQKYQNAADSVGSYMGIYGLSSMLFALLLTFYTSKRQINRKYIHMGSLLLGGLGFILMSMIPDPSWLALCFGLVGIAWGSTLSMPYAMLSSSVDENKMGVYMGLFNMFITIPQIVAALGGITFAYHLIGDDVINAMVLAGISLLLAAVSNLWITNPAAISYQERD